MDPHFLFSVSGPIAIIGWLALLLSPIRPHLFQLVAALVIPLLLSVGYCALILVSWAGAPGGFDSLENVMLLFTVPAVALAGWLHYLAFDLFVGAWEIRTAQREQIAHVLVIPCLLLTFLFGPAGLVIFMILRVSLGLTRPEKQHA